MRVRLSNHQSKQEKKTLNINKRTNNPHIHIQIHVSSFTFPFAKNHTKTHTKFMLIKILDNEHINL